MSADSKPVPTLPPRSKVKRRLFLLTMLGLALYFVLPQFAKIQQALQVVSSLSRWRDNWSESDQTIVVDASMLLECGRNYAGRARCGEPYAAKARYEHRSLAKEACLCVPATVVAACQEL